MKKYRSILTAIVIALCPLEIRAGAGWTDVVPVGELLPTSRHYYEVRLPVTDNPSGCREKNWFYQNYQALGSAQMFAILLEGITSDIRLKVYVTGVCNLNGYSEFSAISVTR